MNQKEQYMQRAIEFARRGAGYTSPNPMVGCVVVKDGHIISEGYHERIGGYHAERNALLSCKEDTKGADLYVTLEPCCHYGKTPPCTEIIIEKQIGRVYVGSLDCNPLVAGKGVQILRNQGIEVETGILEQECLDLNEVFYHYMTTKRPFVVSKYAMSLDGKIACASGDSKWITGEAARSQVHVWRKLYKGIMAGIGTVLADDPMLNCRIEEGVDPIRIICDSKLRIPMESQIVRTAGSIDTITACASDTLQTEAGSAKAKMLADAGVTVVPAGQKQVDLNELMQKLGEMQIDSILLEGGGRLNAAAFEAGIVSKVIAYIGNKVIGGAEAPSPVEGAGAASMAEAVSLERMCIEQIGEDVCITGYPVQKR